jgi:O-antigen/teichoic acid export membrane protein
MIRQFLIYGAGGAASRLAAIFLVPLYTRTLSIDDYGQLEVLLALYMGGTLLIGLQSESAVARDYYEMRTAEERTALYWNGLAISMAGFAALAALAGVAAIVGLAPDSFLPYLPWLLPMALAAQLLGIQLVVLRFAGKPIFFAFLSFLDLALSGLLSAALILAFDLGITGALGGILAAKCVAVAIAWPSTFSLRGGRLSAAAARRMLAYALPTMPSVLMNWLQTTGSRVVLAFFFSLAAVGLVGVAIKIAALYGFLTYSFRLAWEPYSFAKLNAVKDDPALYDRAFQWYVLIMFLTAVAATALSPAILSILAPPIYSEAVRLAGFFIMAQFWVGSISILAIGIHGARVTALLTVVYGAGAALFLFLIAILAGPMGPAAAAIGTLASAILSALIAAHYSARHFGIRFGGSALALAILSSVIFASAAYYLFESACGPASECLILDNSVHSAFLAALGLLLLALTFQFGFGADGTRRLRAEFAAAIAARRR